MTIKTNLERIEDFKKTRTTISAGVERCASTWFAVN